MNFHDTEKISGILLRDGYYGTDNAAEADLIILNTCSVRQKAEQKFYSELGRLKALKKKRPHVKIAVAGCIAQQEGNKLFTKAPYIDFIFGPQNIHLLPQLWEGKSLSSAIGENPFLEFNDLPAMRIDKVRAWINIMYGCDNYCSYCVVPYTRGRERSRPSENICAEISGLSEKGCREVTLLGQNVNSYASDVDFAGLLKKINAISGIDRIRFVTSHPKDLSPQLVRAIAELPKVCEHIHLPLQSGSDSMLMRMNRGYSFEAYMHKVDSLRSLIPNIAITSDIIAGFPGESDEDHRLTMRALTNISFDGIFAFAFSARPFTAAAAYENQIPQAVKLRRLHEILRLQDDITLRRNREIVGSVQEILLEGESETDISKIMGRTRTNKIVTVANADIPKGSLINVTISEARKHSLEGVLNRQ